LLFWRSFAVVVTQQFGSTEPNKALKPSIASLHSATPA